MNSKAIPPPDPEKTIMTRKSKHIQRNPEE